MKNKNLYLQKKVKAIEVRKKSISQLLKEMQDTGFQGRKLAEIVDVWEKMIKDPKLTIVLGYAGSLSTTGQWKIINWLIENRFIDVLVATGANLSEDIVEAMGAELVPEADAAEAPKLEPEDEATVKEALVS